MFNQFSKAGELLAPIPLTVSVIWRVEEGSDYCVENHRYTEEFIALRTLSGAGYIRTKHGEFTAGGDTLLLVPLGEIVSYKTLQPPWHFYWVEFFCGEPLPMNRLLQKETGRREAELLQRCFGLLSARDPFLLMEASGLFSALLAGWLAREGAAQPFAGRMEEALERITRTPLRENLTVEELARGCYMSLRAFREAFARYTGLSPKEYMLSRKLEAARELLRRGDLSVNEVAWQLGFSSPYYFSRIFKIKTGCPPGAYREKA